MLFVSKWWRPLKGDPAGWLLDDDNPAVRYTMLTDVLDRQTDTPVVREARANLARYDLPRRILAARCPDSGWGSPADPATPTWQATADNLVVLAELAARGNDERIATAADWALDQARTPDGDYDLPGAFLWALLRFGYVDDPRVRRASRRAAKSLVARGAPGALIQRDVWDGVPAVWALLQLPESERWPGLEAAIQTGLADIAHIDWASVPVERLAFGFPHLGEADLLLALRVLAQAGRMVDERLQPAVDLLAAQQTERGRWPLARDHRDRLLFPLEAAAAESKWSTLNALRVLRATET